MPLPIYRVDVYHTRSARPEHLASRTEVMDLAEAHVLAAQRIREGMAQVNIVGIDSTGPWIVTTYQPASVAGLHTRPSKD